VGLYHPTQSLEIALASRFLSAGGGKASCVFVEPMESSKKNTEVETDDLTLNSRPRYRKPCSRRHRVIYEYYVLAGSDQERWIDSSSSLLNSICSISDSEAAR